MTRKNNLMFSLVLTIGFVLCLFLPILHFAFGNDLIGAEAFVFNFARLFLVQDFIEYLKVVSTVVTNLFVLILLIWSYRSRLKFLPTLLLSSFTLVSALYWGVKYQDKDVLLFGYWVWIAFIIVLIGFNFYKLKTQGKVELSHQ